VSFVDAADAKNREGRAEGNTQSHEKGNF